jgi:hypothetical protein
MNYIGNIKERKLGKGDPREEMEISLYPIINIT